MAHHQVGGVQLWRSLGSDDKATSIRALSPLCLLHTYQLAIVCYQLGFAHPAGTLPPEMLCTASQQQGGAMATFNVACSVLIWSLCHLCQHYSLESAPVQSCAKGAL